MKEFFKFTFASCLGFLLSFIIVNLLLFSIIIGSIHSFSSSSAVNIAPNSVLHIELQGVIAEQPQEIPFYDTYSNRIRNINLHDLIKSIQQAKDDDNIIGIVIEAGILSSGYATIQEVREALEQFKLTNKFIYAYGNVYSQATYLLSSVADSLFIHPSGNIDIKGLSSQPIFFKNTLSKLGINMQVIKLGDYKGATETFTRTNLSEENRKQTNWLLAQFWDDFKFTVSASRNIPPEDIDNLATQSMIFVPAREYIKNKLVDNIMYPDELEVFLKNRIGEDFDPEQNLIKWQDYNTSDGQNKKTKVSKDLIAVIIANGGIDDGSTDGIDSKKLSKLLAKQRKDKDTKAVVLRINSPGGSAFGAEQIWREVFLYKGEKPIIVSMGDYAASGGYYIATAADSIFVQQQTITGSIGIFGIIPDFANLSDKLGISYDVVKTHKLADFPSFTRALTPEERLILEQYMLTTYNLFLQRCTEGRNMQIEQLLPLAGGRVWSGNDAVKNGLADKIGSLQDAINAAASMANIENYEVVHLPKKKTWWEILMDDSSNLVESMLTKGLPLEQYRLIKQYTENNINMVIQARTQDMLIVW